MEKCKTCRRPINSTEPYAFIRGWWYCADHGPLAEHRSTDRKTTITEAIESCQGPDGQLID